MGADRDAVRSITSSGAEITAVVSEGSAPAGPLWTFYFALIVLFTSFAVVYVVDIVRPIGARRPAICGYPLPSDRDFWCVLLSMVSKTSLHLYIGLIVLSQGERPWAPTTPAPLGHGDGGHRARRHHRGRAGLWVYPHPHRPLGGSQGPVILCAPDPVFPID